MKLNIRKAIESDMKSVLKLIKELASFENEPDAVQLSAKDLTNHGFGEKPAFKLYVAELENEIVGIALFYERYSTWKGKAIHLEDLIVQEKHRARGIGNALYSKVMEYAYNHDYKRVAWEVLDWNTSAIKFYESTGAKVLKNWKVAQMDEKSLKKFVKKIKH